MTPGKSGRHRTARKVSLLKQQQTPKLHMMVPMNGKQWEWESALSLMMRMDLDAMS